MRKQKIWNGENKSYIFVHNHQAWTISLTATIAIKTNPCCFRPKCQESLINIHWKWNSALEGKKKNHKTKRQWSHVCLHYSFMLIISDQEQGPQWDSKNNHQLLVALLIYTTLVALNRMVKIIVEFSIETMSGVYTCKLSYTILCCQRVTTWSLKCFRTLLCSC